MNGRLLLLFCLSTVSLSRGQGILRFGAGISPGTQITTNAFVGGPPSGLLNGALGSYYFALFVAPSSVTSYSGWNPTLSGFIFTGDLGTNTNPGIFSGNNGPGYDEVKGYVPGSTASFTVVGWSAALGSTWAQAEASMNSGRFPGTGLAFFGNSGVAQVPLGGGILPPYPIFGHQPYQILGFNLSLLPGSVAAVPEPGAFALLALAAAALPFFRRHR